MQHLLGCCLLVAFLGDTIYAQEISGHITDQETGEPIAYANVYLANTLIGTTTDSEGNFTLKKIPVGKYDFTISFVGYETFGEALEINEKTSVERKVILKPALETLPEVFVMADTSHWQYNFNVFKSSFIGVNDFSPEVNIENKMQLAFYFDDDTKILYAHARNPLRVQNRALGYRLIYDLRLFEFDMKRGKLQYLGIPRFEELGPKNNRQLKRWEKHRVSAYYGSSLHFMRVLYNRGLSASKFMVQELYSISNPKKPPQNWLDAKLDKFRNLIKNGGLNTGQRMMAGDSLSFYERLDREPDEIDSLGKRIESAAELINKKNQMVSTGRYLIMYDEKVPPSYPYKRADNERQQSVLVITRPVEIFSNGYYDNPQAVYVNGYWSWSQTISSFLPLNYEPKRE